MAALTASALVFAAPTGASAQPVAAVVKPKLLSDQVGAPFNLAVTKSQFLVADGGPPVVGRLRADGSLKTIAKGPAGGDVAGIAVGRGGAIAYTTTGHPTPEANENGALHVRKGSTTTNVDLAAYEAKANPDQTNTYGVKNPSTCVADALKAMEIPVRYTGEKDSHPYSVVAYGKSSWLVADAGGNDLLKVNKRGKVSTVAVLPAQPLKVTAAIATALHLPDCVVGVTYKFEPVPTDVEIGPHGYVYVSTLAGGPEDAVLGGRSSVYRVNPKNGHVKRVATGLFGATNLALYQGKIYVSQFYTGEVAVIAHHVPKTYVELPGVVSIEAGRGHLYAGTLGDPAGPGTIVRLR